MASKKSTAKDATKGITGRMGKELTQLANEGERVQIVGTMKNGKLQLDQKTIADLERRWPNANIAFVAVNAPFDPTPGQTTEAPVA